MGAAVYETAAANPEIEITAGIDIAYNSESKHQYPIFKTVEDFSESGINVDVIIDFSHHSLLPGLMAFASEAHIPAVISTTGHDELELQAMKNASKTIPVFYSRNMSLGINLLIELAKKAAAMLSDDFDIEIIEKHHNQKLDAPSGTALMIADELTDMLPYEPEYIYDRHTVRKKRDKNEIGIHTVRGGNIVGEHEVIFAGQNEVITISHSASSRGVFASGALRAALFIFGKPAGMYNMRDIVNEIDI